MALTRGLDLLRAASSAPLMAQTRASPARARLRAEALALARAEALVEPAASWRIVPLDAPPAATLRAGGEVLHAPRLLPPSGRLTALGCAVCTLGPGLEQRVRALFAARRASLALALDELGNELLFELARRTQDRLHAAVARRGWTMAGELRAGDPGLDLAAQPAVLRLADAAAIGVVANEQLLMQPHKSTSMVHGVGVDLPPAAWSRCDDCSHRPKCRAVARIDAQRAAAAADAHEGAAPAGTPPAAAPASAHPAAATPSATAAAAPPGANEAAMAARAALAAA